MLLLQPLKHGKQLHCPWNAHRESSVGILGFARIIYVSIFSDNYCSAMLFDKHEGRLVHVSKIDGTIWAFKNLDSENLARRHLGCLD